MLTQGKLLQHGKPQRWGAKPQLDSREGQAGPSGVADRLVVPRKSGNSDGGKGPEFKEAACRGKGQGEWCKPMNLPYKRSRFEGGDPQSPTVSRLSPVFPCPRAGCGKSARPGSTSGEWKRSVSHRATPRLYMNLIDVPMPRSNPRRHPSPRTPTVIGSSVSDLMFILALISGRAIT
jgi:hypothetical protein